MNMLAVELGMKKITAGYLKKNCAAILREVQTKHNTVVIGKHDKPVAMLVPLNEVKDDIFGFLKG
jgi:prevent-host-death family protein